MALLSSMALLFLLSHTLKAKAAYYNCYSSSSFNDGSKQAGNPNSFLFAVSANVMGKDVYYFAPVSHPSLKSPECLGLCPVGISGTASCFACIHSSCSAIGNSCPPKLEITAPQRDSPTTQRFGLCFPNLTQSDCTACLQAASNHQNTCQGAILLTSTCVLCYQPAYHFYKFSLPSSTTSTLASPPTRKEGRNSRTLLVAAIVVPTTLVLTVAALVTCAVNKKRKRTAANEESTDVCFEFSLGSIRGATNNFSASNKLGRGGYGEVYRGTLPNSQQIAVKRLVYHSVRGDMEFRNEVRLVARLHHKNLIRLIGFCIGGKERILVYELALHGSLDRHLFDPTRREQLDWKTRYNIIEGIARGMLYLHEESQLRIIHRDLKAGNILLDEFMNPKISDFGTAKLFLEEQGSASKIVGTYGYMSPEYVKHGKISIKIDVFSFGVLLLEIVCGRKNSTSENQHQVEHLLSKAWIYWTTGRALELIDPILLRESDQIDEIKGCLHIGLLCVQNEPQSRPTMNSVILMLEGCSQGLPTPSEPAYFMDFAEQKPNKSKMNLNRLALQSCESASYSGQRTSMLSVSSSASVNEISITGYPEPR